MTKGVRQGETLHSVKESLVWLLENKKEVDTNCSIRAIRNNVFISTSCFGLLIKRRLMQLGGAL